MLLRTYAGCWNGTPGGRGGQLAKRREKGEEQGEGRPRRSAGSVGRRGGVGSRCWERGLRCSRSECLLLSLCNWILCSRKLCAQNYPSILLSLFPQKNTLASISYLSGSKTYRAGVKLGFETTTLDMAGNITQHHTRILPNHPGHHPRLHPTRPPQIHWRNHANTTHI